MTDDQDFWDQIRNIFPNLQIFPVRNPNQNGPGVSDETGSELPPNTTYIPGNDLLH
jgi:hypothetical protein